MEGPNISGVKLSDFASRVLVGMRSYE